MAVRRPEEVSTLGLLAALTCATTAGAAGFAALALGVKGVPARGEDRCQAEVDGGSATSLRPPNDLGYIASMLRQIGVTPFYR